MPSTELNSRYLLTPEAIMASTDTDDPRSGRGRAESHQIFAQHCPFFCPLFSLGEISPYPLGLPTPPQDRCPDSGETLEYLEKEARLTL